jgi:hypothetical protein
MDTAVHSKGLITIDGGKIFDVISRTDPPYMEDDLFLFAPARSFIKSNVLEIRIPDRNESLISHTKNNFLYIET